MGMVKKYAVLENNIVVNIVLATQEVANINGWIACNNTVDKGWHYDSGTFYVVPNIVEQSLKIRSIRSALLAESDLQVLPDRWAIMTPSTQEAWSLYRQALRDIPSQGEFPWNVTWPEQPE